MKIQAIAALAAIGAALSGCGTITQGTSQDIAIVSNPPGAQCVLVREGQTVATLLKTPGTVKVDKTKHDMVLTCNLAGYQAASAPLESGYGIGTFGNIILGGGIGWAIDSASGADNKYPSSATVNLIPVGVTPPAPPVAPATVVPAN